MSFLNLILPHIKKFKYFVLLAIVVAELVRFGGQLLLFRRDA